MFSKYLKVSKSFLFSIFITRKSSISNQPFASLPSNIIYGKIPSTFSNSSKLVLLFAWMNAKDGHLEKYRQFWFDRGFDILTIQTSPSDLLIPHFGTQRNSASVHKFLSTIEPRYQNVIFHTFSVGTYASFDFIYKLRQLAKFHPEARDQLNSFRGLVMDSVTWTKDSPTGVAKSITTNPIIQKLISTSIAAYYVLSSPISLRHYMKVEKIFYRNRLPALLLFSEQDGIGDPDVPRRMARKWKRNGALVRVKCWDKSPHVLHYKEHPQEYSQEVDRFLEEIKLK